jgi:GT2 family glycosyltransferase
MAVSKNALEEVGGFHPWLDRVEDKLLSSGDVFLQKEIVRRGYRSLYVPEMAIDHLVPASRLRQEWFLQRFYWQGISDAVMHLIELSPSPAGRLRAALGRACRLIGNRRRLKSLLSSSTNPELFALKCMAALDLGFILGLLGAARR